MPDLLPFYTCVQTIGQRDIHLQVPTPSAVAAVVRTNYHESPANPYWAQVWPAARALARYIDEHSTLVRDKIVLELGAGLGLPSLAAAAYAKAVCCSDADPRAVAFIRANADLNKCRTLEACVLDWNQLHQLPAADVLLLSDVNYDPTDFPRLLELIHHYHKQGSCILLATPQRLLAKSFAAELLLLCQEAEELMVEHAGKGVWINIYHL
ncbi:MAG TPA: 50S ribosomal protein L11 methyltransferase [Lacibacter sp.]|nr:50S ribosomal protein L11 methyltransferase [Lacibacter sp.]HMO90344.1 50S ribosomal protein L11 methyltransferase [Lacibacter sp.]HMP87342.1 50S ribosomal protein L11 methyltransferase [Lacibacter sp.]